jgi:RNase P/RNase MRP subunit POP5
VLIIKGEKRQRYIGFTVNAPVNQVDKSSFLYEIRRICNKKYKKNLKEMGIWLIRFNGSTGILKCNHQEKENAILLLQSVKNIGLNKVKIIPVGTSGTIRSLIKKHLSNHI